ncbi:MAG: gamma-glutamyl-gamma-aminobutyrate hydrolase family protein [Anaerolineaceae bacterium]
MTQKQPLIGLTTSNGRKTDNIYIPKTYIEAVQAAGGLAILIPAGTGPDQVSQLREALDGLLIIGGADIDPGLFGEESSPHVQLDGRERDDLEIALVQTAVDSDWPLLGICRGLQVINVALGGSLYTHIPDQLPGALKHNMDTKTQRDVLAHSVDIQPSTQIASIVGTGELKVNSLHHQGIRRLGERLLTTGASPDGLVESIEIPGHPFALGVQWHPECLPDSAPMRRLFSAFVEKAAALSSARGSRDG